MDPEFLTKDQVLRLHDLAIQDYGGSTFIRDYGLLDSAIAEPKSSFDGEFLHESVFLMAAAYYYHLSQNQPFSDGNKRTGKLCMQLFLEANDYLLAAPVDEYYEMLMDVAEGRKSKQDLAIYIEQYSTRII